MIIMALHEYATKFGISVTEGFEEWGKSPIGITQLFKEIGKSPLSEGIKLEKIV
jgi:hypothetical protein